MLVLGGTQNFHFSATVVERNGDSNLFNLGDIDEENNGERNSGKQ